jgi:hypothetical protein
VTGIAVLGILARGEERFFLQIMGPYFLGRLEMLIVGVFFSHGTIDLGAHLAAGIGALVYHMVLESRY